MGLREAVDIADEIFQALPECGGTDPSPTATFCAGATSGTKIAKAAITSAAKAVSTTGCAAGDDIVIIWAIRCLQSHLGCLPDLFHSLGFF